MFEPLPPDVADAIGAARDRLGAYADVRFVEAVASTNDLAIALAESGHSEGTSVLSDLQNAGRGRRGRSWFSPAGAGLYLSVIVRPRRDTERLPLVTLAAGAAMAHAVLRATGLPVELKWPNDLVVGRPWRKIGGVLTEAVTTGAHMDAMVIGMGINLTPASYPRELADRATSIEIELGRPVNRATVLIALLEELKAIMTHVHAHEAQTICDTWRRYGAAGLDHRPVQWHGQEVVRRGRVLDIDTDGALLVESDGRVERVIAGEVTWETLSRE